MTKEDYNKIPVHFCKNCGSLAILCSEENRSNTYCRGCGSIETSITNIDTWEAIYGKSGKVNVSV